MTAGAHASAASVAAGVLVAIVFAAFSEPSRDGTSWYAPLFLETDALAVILGFIIGYYYPKYRRLTMVAGAIPLVGLGLTSQVLGLPQGYPDVGWYYALAAVSVIYVGMIAVAGIQREENAT